MGFADIGLSYEFAVALGGLIALTFVVALGRLLWKKRKLAQNQIKRDVEAAEKVTQKAVMREKVRGEGDYFGVRAIERGYFGGVAQSTPTTANNSPQLSPVRGVGGGDGSPASIAQSRRSSVSELSLSSPNALRSPSSVKSLRTGGSIRSLRLQPSDAELSGRRNHDPTASINTFGPSSSTPPTSPLAVEVSTELKPIPDASRTPVPSTMRPMLNRQVQSYAQWRLSAEVRSSTHAKRRKSSVKFRDLPAKNVYAHPQTGRRRSRSASTLELANQIRALQQELGARIAADAVASLARSSSTVGDRISDTPLQSSRRLSRSQDAECDPSIPSKGACKNIKRNRGELRRNSKFAANPAVQRRRQSRPLNKIIHDPSTSHRNDSKCATGRTVKLDRPSSLLSRGRAYVKHCSSGSPSKSGSTTRSRSRPPLSRSQSPSTSNISFAPSIEWTPAESNEDEKEMSLCPLESPIKK